MPKEHKTDTWLHMSFSIDSVVGVYVGLTSPLLNSVCSTIYIQKRYCKGCVCTHKYSKCYFKISYEFRRGLCQTMGITSKRRNRYSVLNRVKMWRWKLNKLNGPMNIRATSISKWLKPPVFLQGQAYCFCFLPHFYSIEDRVSISSLWRYAHCLA
jgi:hypothetical protein